MLPYYPLRYFSEFTRNLRLKISKTDYQSNQKDDPANTLYIILYAIEAAEDNQNNWRPDYRKALQEIDSIRKRFPHMIEVTKAPIEAVVEVMPVMPVKKKVKVCGFRGEQCVKDLTFRLKDMGYDAEVSLEGTCR